MPRRREDTKKINLNNDSFYTVFDEWYIEINEKAEMFSGQFQVTQYLSLPNRIHLIDCFQFANNKVFH